jgi:hypothetical protein
VCHITCPSNSAGLFCYTGCLFHPFPVHGSSIASAETSSYTCRALGNSKRRSVHNIVFLVCSQTPDRLRSSGMLYRVDW